MNDYKRGQTASDCPPSPSPADQPHLPTESCDPWPPTKPPDLEKPKKCSPDPECKCPPTPGADSNCLEELIATQAKEVAAAEKAKLFKTDLEGLLAKAKAASLEYNEDKYEQLRKDWLKQDCEIAELIRKLVCALPCWLCIIECHVCLLLNELHYAEEWLYGDGTLYSEVHNLHDLKYWYERDLDAKRRRFERIKTVLTAWEKPAQTIEKALADDAKLIAEVGKTLGSDASKAVYDVFLRLVPMHLAIAPPKAEGWTTAIGIEYTRFCKCDVGQPDDCCGPDVGELSLRHRLIGPQPYLVDPIYYFKIICCLVEKRYGPAKDALAAAEAQFQDADARIKRYKAQVENGLKSFDKDARNAIPRVVDCDDYASCEGEQQKPAAR